jgi:hypothetical protein
LPLAVIGEAIARMPVKKLIEFYEKCSELMRQSAKRSKSKGSAKPAPKRKSAAVMKAKTRK